MEHRHRLLTWLFEVSAAPYASLKRRTPWSLTREELQRFPVGSLGHVLGHYLEAQAFELMPNFEVHDICHLLTGTPTDVPGEVCLQFLLFGNGKRSAYLFGSLLIGGVLFPELWGAFAAAREKGQRLPRFFDVDYRSSLETPYEDLVLEAVQERRHAA